MKFSISNMVARCVAVALLLLTACHGKVNELERPNAGGSDSDDNGSMQSGLIISASKTTIEADGDDYVTFSLRLDGEELTADDSTLANVYFKNAVTGKRLERYATTFSAVKNGKYTFVATYKGKTSENSVVITAKNREKYEPYGQKMLVYDLTGTWCAYCPQMTAALENISAEWKENVVVMAVHASSDSVDPYAITYGKTDLGGAMLSMFGGQGYPSCVYDLAYLNGERTASGIESLVQEHLRNYPAKCGVKILSSSLESGLLTVDAAITSVEGGEYDLGYVLLLDNQYYAGGTATDNMYNDIVCAFSSNFLQMSDSRFTLAAGEERTKRFELSGVPYTSMADLRVVVFALTKVGGKTIVDNANVCALGSSVDYMPVSEVDYTLPDTDIVDPDVLDGVLYISADKTTIKADGVDAVTFKVNFGHEDVSNARTMNLIKTFNGETVELAAGANTFTCTAAGTYTFKARYYKGGEFVTADEVVITATNSNVSGSTQFRHQLLGMQFTSVGCTYCPQLSTSIKLIEEEQPLRLVPVSFHLDYNVTDPMRIAMADTYYKKFGSGGLPLFVLDVRDGEKMTSNKSVMESEMAKILANHPTTCGVAINTSYNATTRSLTITPRITSTVSASYRYLVMLTESGIEYAQYGVTGDYTHNNVVRRVLSDNVYGVKFNSGAVLAVGEDTAISSPLTLTLDESWNVENMRVVFSALTTSDGGATYNCNNTTSCKVGESVDYLLED